MVKNNIITNYLKTKKMRTKTLAITITLALSIISFTSCSQDENRNKFITKDGNTLIETHTKEYIIDSINNEINSLFKNSKMRTQKAVQNMQPAKCEQILSPLTPCGAKMRDDLVELGQMGELNITTEEIEQLKEMDDAELAEFAYYVSAISQAPNPEKPVDLDLNDVSRKISYTKQDVLDCISFSTGLSFISGGYGYVEGTISLISAKTAWNVARVMISRTLGWVGVAVAIYDFTDCMRSKQKR